MNTDDINQISEEKNTNIKVINDSNLQSEDELNNNIENKNDNEKSKKNSSKTNLTQILELRKINYNKTNPKNLGINIDSESDDLFDDVSVYSELDNQKMNDINNASLKIEMKNLNEHIQEKINKLDVRMRYANYKFEDVRASFKNFSIAVIFLATLLTLVEAFMNSVDIDSLENTALKSFVRFIPLVISSVISLIAALIKFNKYEEKIEDISRATEKCIGTMSKLKEAREELYFCKTKEQFNKISNLFVQKVYKNYLESNVNIEKQLKDPDYAKYMKKVATNDIKMNKISVLKKRYIDGIKKCKDDACVKIQIDNLSEIDEMKTKKCCGLC